MENPQPVVRTKCVTFYGLLLLKIAYFALKIGFVQFVYRLNAWKFVVLRFWVGVCKYIKVS